MALICVVAHPSVRTLCPPDYVEGVWLEVTEYIMQIGILKIPRDGEAYLVARPTWRMARRDDLVSARVWEITRS